MAENESSSSDDKTEEPTARRLQKAREEGQVAKSPDFAAAAMLTAGAVLISTVGGRAISKQAVELFRIGPNWLLMEQPTVLGVTALLKTVVFRVVVSMTPLAVGLAIVALAVGLIQTRGLLTSKPLEPDLSRIDPLAGLKRIFGAEAAVNLIKSILKLTLLGIVVYGAIKSAWPHFIVLTDESPAAIAKALGSVTLKMALTVGLAFLAIGAFDYGIQFIRTHKGLKMSRHEVIQEHKEQEGDPHIKARIRQIGRQRARSRMLSHVKTADVVITNPTHIAIALRYDTALSGAPVVVAMGERKLAERIKAIARAANVPMVENKPLARALLATSKVGAPIPPAMYVAVAEILAWVYRTRRRSPGGMSMSSRNPIGAQ